MTPSQARLASIPLAEIDVGERLRPLSEANVLNLADALSASGLLNPVLLRPVGARFALVAGAHRHAAAVMLGWSHVDATIREMGDDEARLFEIDENLRRQELAALDRAMFLHARKQVWERLHPQTTHGGDRKSLTKNGENQVATLATWSRFTAEAAEQVGLGERTIQRACQLVEDLNPAVLQRLRGTDLARNQGALLKLSRLAPAEQLRVAEGVLSGTLRSIATPKALAAPDDQEILVRRATALWVKAGAKTRRRILAAFGVDAFEIERIVNPRSRRVRGAVSNVA